ncbi:ribonuclease P protein component [Alkalicaulis satelles]|uniref:ribonuclease P protein component n=1 Tax=Alkalicaulis satelles TaxID=2609175 RepID=UPI0022B857F3|nr:ribonuclease P protein component [Alkalicaulis satelles]
MTVRRDFLRARDGVRAARPGVVIQALPRSADPHGPARAGFTATRKIGPAVVRNRAKRRLREAARLLLPLHGAPGTDYVFIARAATPDRAWPSLLDDVESALISLAPRVRAGRNPDPA